MRPVMLHASLERAKICGLIVETLTIVVMSIAKGQQLALLDSSATKPRHVTVRLTFHFLTFSSSKCDLIAIVKVKIRVDLRGTARQASTAAMIRVIAYRMNFLSAIHTAHLHPL